MHWMIKEFIFKNIGPFVNETKLDLTAKLNDEDKVLIRFSNSDRRILKFNKIIGIFGPNASGKTKILDAITFYLQYNSLETVPRFFSSFFDNINNKKKVFYIKAIITNGQEEIHHKISYHPSNLKDDFFFGELDIKNFFSESIELLNLKTETISEIFNNEKFEKNKYKFIEKFNFNNAGIINESNSLEKSKQLFKEYLIGEFQVSNDKEKIDFQSIIESLEKKVEVEEKIYDALNSVCQFEINNNYVFKQNYDFVSLPKTRLKLSHLVDKLIKQGYDEKKLSEYLTNISRICDRSVEKILVKNRFSKSKTLIGERRISQENAYSFQVKFFDRDLHNSLSVLSTGTLNLIIIFLELLNISKTTNGHRLIIVDELGQSWHSSMTANFLEFLDETSILSHNTLIFTSHQPEIGDFMRRDAVWIIDRNHFLKPLYSFKNPLTNNDFSRVRFSKIYYDEILDVFQTNPSITDFLDSNVEDYFEDEVF